MTPEESDEIARERTQNRFEDVELAGIGNLMRLDGESVDALRGRIDSTTHGVFIVGHPSPEGWPAEIMHYGSMRTLSGHVMSVVTFRMLRDGCIWENFYSFGDLTEGDEIPGFIYERRGVTYIPLVDMTVSPDGIILQASHDWCVVALKFAGSRKPK